MFYQEVVLFYGTAETEVGKQGSEACTNSLQAEVGLPWSVKSWRGSRLEDPGNQNTVRWDIREKK